MSDVVEQAFVVKEVLTLEEFRKVTDVMWVAFYHPYSTSFHIRHILTGPTDKDWEDSKAADAVSLWDTHKANPASRWIMVVETATDKVVAGMQWYFHHENPWPNGPKPIKVPGWPEGSEVAEYASRFFTGVFRPQMMWCQRPHSGINSTGVLPEYRRRGIGHLMMKWGVDRTDEYGYDCFLEGTPIGSRLYEAAGFRLLMKHFLDMSKPDPSPTWIRLTHDWSPNFPISLLWRPPYGQWTEKTPEGPWAFKYEGSAVKQGV